LGRTYSFFFSYNWGRWPKWLIGSAGIRNIRR